MRRRCSRLALLSSCSAARVAVVATILICVSTAGATICASSPLLCGDMSPPPAYDATFITTAGNFTQNQVHSELAWAPLGSARFYTLCRMGYYSQVKGIASNTAVSSAWTDAFIENDAPLLSNTRGTVAFAADYDVRKQPPVAVNRTTQVFVNLNNSNWRLDKNIFVPFGVVIEEDGMKTFDNLFSGYGQEPDQDLIYSRGFAYLSSNFPLLSYTNAVDVKPSQPWPRAKWPPLAASSASSHVGQDSTSGAQSSLQAVIVVICVLALMLLALAAFKIKRKVVYAQQIA